MDALVILFATLLALVLGITVHEFSHALSADLLGDSTARYQGRLTLNPIAHFDPIGGIMILFSTISGFGFGWGKPVPVNPVNLRPSPRVGMALTSFAGPFSNVALATLAAAPLRIAPGLPLSAQEVLYIVVRANVALALFNLLPIPPLDGFSVLRGIVGLVRARWAYDVGDLLDRVASFGPMVFIGIILIDRLLPGQGIIWRVLSPLYNLLMRLILGIRA